MEGPGHVTSIFSPCTLVVVCDCGSATRGFSWLLPGLSSSSSGDEKATYLQQDRRNEAGSWQAVGRQFAHSRQACDMYECSTRTVPSSYCYSSD